MKTAVLKEKNGNKRKVSEREEEMEFRPCIDIHNGRVKQIVGGTLSDKGNYAAENYVAQQDGAFYARLYRDAGIPGGHVILRNGHDRED